MGYNILQWVHSMLTVGTFGQLTDVFLLRLDTIWNACSCWVAIMILWRYHHLEYHILVIWESESHDTVFVLSTVDGAWGVPCITSIALKTEVLPEDFDR